MYKKTTFEWSQKWSSYTGLTVVSKRHLKKLDKFRKREAVMGNERKPSIYIKHTVHNFLSYMSDEEYKALYYELDHHIPTFSNYHAVETEFELFYPKHLSNISHMPENELTQLKSKFRNVCHKHDKIKVLYKYQIPTDYC